MLLIRLNRHAAALALAGVSLFAHAADKPAVIENSVVKVFSTLRGPDPFKPWTRASPQDASGSGVVIEGRRILTNAHVVGYASLVQIQGNEQGDKINATVEAISPGIDLAVLKLDDEAFFKTHPPAPRSTALPAVREQVFAYGYPTGGTSLSITKGIVSRIEFVPYSYPTSGLRMQVDAAINAGNSGGPVIAGDRMIGLAFARAAEGQNIGYIIPNEEIDLFLRDVADGKYDGKPALYDELQTLESAALREWLKLPAGVAGAVVRKPAFPDAAYPLKEWDVITHIGDKPIDNQAMISAGPSLRLSFRYLVQHVARDGKVPLTIVRGGKTLQVQVPVTTYRKPVVASLEGAYPSYFIYGPMVFSRATNEFNSFFTNNLGAFNALSGMASPMVTQRGEYATPEREELVVISSPFFPHKTMSGYSSRPGSVVDSVNGVKVRSLAHLVTLLRDSVDELLVFRFDQRGAENIVVRRKDMAEATEGVLNDNGIRLQASPDMLKIWERK
ncbi:MAG: trypsin-like peptidase domain-containing protein [Gammaproteobacteria bacterium]